MEILVIDIETTGFQNAGAHIVEIGASLLNLDNGNITPMMDVIVHEDGMTLEEVENSWIVKNSNLTVELIQHSVHIKYVLPILQKLVSKYRTTAYNRNFDVNFLTSRGIQFNELYPCPMLELTPILKLSKAFNRNGYKWPSVEESYRHFFGDNYNEHHRAGQDTIDESKIIYELHKIKESYVTR